MDQKHIKIQERIFFIYSKKKETENLQHHENLKTPFVLIKRII